MNSLPWQNLDNTPATRQKALIFFICLFFSFVAWISIKLSRESSAELTLQFNVVNVPADLIFTAQTDSAFVVRIQSTGLRLLTSRLMRSLGSLETDFGLLQQTRRNNRDAFFITASQAEGRFSMISEIPRHSLRMQPDTIFLFPEPAFRKKVPVILQKEIDFLPGYRLYDIPQILPDSVFISGPLHMKDSVHFIQTSLLRANRAAANIRASVQLQNPWKRQHIKLSQKTAEVLIPIEEFTEASVDLSLMADCPELFAQSQTGDLLLFPDQVNVSYLVALKDLQSITSDMFRAFVQCPDTSATEGLRLRIELREKPGLVEIIRLRPQEVEYLLIKR